MLNKRADTDFPKHNGPHVGPHVMHPLCDIIQAHALLCMRERYLVLDKPDGRGACWIDLGWPGPELQESATGSQSPRGCRWARCAIGPFTPKVQTQGERNNFGGRFSWATIGWARFSIAMVRWWHGEVMNNPSRGGEPVPRPRKGNPLGGPVRGIFISSPSHWPVSATVESRESGVEVLGGPVVERIIVIRGRVAL